MSATASPYGMKPVELGGGAVDASIRWYPLGANNTNAIFAGDPVNVTSGVVIAIATTPTTTRGTNTPIGIAVAFQYVLPSPYSQPQWANFMPAGAVTAGYGTPMVGVIDSPGAVFQIQADGSIATTAVGKNAALTNFNAGSTVNGNSTVKLLASSVATTNTLGVKIVGFITSGSSVAGDAFTDVLVRWNAGVHAYGNSTGG